MRVALIAPPWVAVPPRAYGGTEAVLDGLARGLAAAGHEVLLCTTGDSTCPVPRSWRFDTALGIAPSEESLSELQHVVAAYQAAEGCDVVHDHTVAGPLYGAGRSKTAVIATNHHPFERGMDELYGAVAEQVPVIAVSHAQASTARLSRLAGVIHHGVDVLAVPPGEGKGGYDVFLGRMSADKGVHLAAEVARAAGRRLLIAGKCRAPSELDYFERQVRPLLGAGVEYLGEVQASAKAALLGGARCLLNPICWSEPFGMVMIEALACGTPVVALANGAAPEIVEDGGNGLLATDVPGLLGAMERVGEIDRGWCRRDAERRFSTERMVADHLACYEALRYGELA